MFWKIFSGFLFLLSIPVILVLVLVSLALFVPGQKCPDVDISQVGSLDKILKDFERTGIGTLTNAQATSILRSNFDNNPDNPVQNLSVCFKENELGISGNVKLASFKPSFYLQTQVNSEDQLKAENTRVSIGGLGKIPGMDMLFGGIAQGMINDNLAKIPQDKGKTTVELKDGQVTIKQSQKKR